MARNGSGTHSIPNTMVSGAAITAAGHNQNYSDISTEITNSVAADGQTTMTGALKASSGTAAAPGITFGADTNTGAYRSGADEYSVAAGGVQIHKTSSAGIDVVSGKLKEGGYSLIPPGFIGPYGGSSAPGGWLLCNGSAVSRTTYADLFGVIGSTYGSGDGSTTFNLPDLGGRVPAGKEATATRLTSAVSGVDGGTLGATGGTQSHTLTQAQLPNYSLTVTDPGHTHSGTYTGSGSASGNITYAVVQAGSSIGALVLGGGAESITSASGTTGISVSSAGSDAAHTITQPTIIVNYIIKT